MGVFWQVLGVCVCGLGWVGDRFGMGKAFTSSLNLAAPGESNSQTLPISHFFLLIYPNPSPYPPFRNPSLLKKKPEPEPFLGGEAPSFPKVFFFWFFFFFFFFFFVYGEM